MLRAWHESDRGICYLELWQATEICCLRHMQAKHLGVALTLFCLYGAGHMAIEQQPVQSGFLPGSETNPLV